jgi:hypothetical protein
METVVVVVVLTVVREEVIKVVGAIKVIMVPLVTRVNKEHQVQLKIQGQLVLKGFVAIKEIKV